ncbi:DUF2953 domain-containing protein [Caproiciproducens faecalis]|uniref:DUF2953 domain-containing protein n=1 Tax=Caproiciproducens faecalis TaxID=2820301 RepID=A0ABS7DS66_9FIRM|nr:DUF2953 domain-containing protein [Caproiciproducens faecalis]MBW7573989.1 DUF2953 domain-containing protein [Caproiciproducens faecalis]
MTALMIFMGIALFLFVLLLFPVSVSARFEEELSIKIKYLFFSYKIPADTPKAEDTGKSGKKKTGDKSDAYSKFRDIIKRKGLSGFLDIISEFASIATGAAKKLFSHAVIHAISVDISVSDEDAAQTAIYYGCTCSVVYPAMGLLVNQVKCKDYHIRIAPDFNEKESRITFTCKVKIKLLFILSSMLPALLESLKMLKKIKINPVKIKNSTDKAVH